VIRDRHSREVELVPQSEGPARFARQLHKLALCLQAIGLEGTAVDVALQRIALDSIGSPRREVLEHVLDSRADSRRALKTAEIAARHGLPTTTTRRALEDAAALGLLLRRKTGPGETSALAWYASPEALELWDSAFPANSPTPSPLGETPTPEREIAGKAGEAVDEEEIERLADLSREAQPGDIDDAGDPSRSHAP
jgi:hypothetical protein